MDVLAPFKSSNQCKNDDKFTTCKRCTTPLTKRVNSNLKKVMTTRPQIPFVFFKDDKARLLDLQKQVNERNKLDASLAVVLRLAIRVCPLESTLNLKALELLEDDRRRADQNGPKKDLYRMSCMVTPKEQEKLDLILSLISPILRPKIKRSSLGRLVLKLTASSLIMLQTSREVFFDDLRRRDTDESKKPRRSTRRSTR